MNKSLSILALSTGILSSFAFAADTTPALAAASAATPQASALSNFFPLIIIVLILIFFFWTQRRRSGQMNKLLASLSEGDEISMNNGLMGKIAKIGEQAITVEIADGVKIKVQKNAVLQVLPKGTLNDL